jgi:hypothetical protein
MASATGRKGEEDARACVYDGHANVFAAIPNILTP